MTYKKTFHCFHGTTMAFYKDIQHNQKFVIEQRENHWLGNGVYFFLDDQLKAAWWAEMAARKEKRVSNKNVLPCVLYIEAQVDIDKIIDLNIEKGQQVLEDFISYLKKNGVAIRQHVDEKIPENEKEHYFRCKVMDLLVESSGYLASCYLFPNQGKPYMFEGLSDYGIISNKGNQLCIYDQSILDFSRMQLK